MAKAPDSRATGPRPCHGWIGLGLVAAFWFLNWSLEGLRTHWGFFPLWLGYCLTVDALTFRRTGTSPFSRGAKAYIGLFIVSAPAWWLFEVINWRTQNWFYLSRERFSDLEYFLLASLSFSTVIPAVLGTAELIGSFRWVRRFGTGPVFAPCKRGVLAMFLIGWASMGLVLIWPRYFFPLLWGALYFILEPINVWLGHRSLFRHTARGDWRPVAALFVGCLVCGFFWEMWNFYSYPKWVYQIPFVDFCRVFEMPILGYIGYLPFSLELMALYHLVAGLASKALGASEWSMDTDRLFHV